MSIIYFNVGQTGQVGEAPRRNQLISSDSFARITQPGYLNASNTSGKQIFPTDVFDVLFNYTGTSTFNVASAFGTGTFQQFVPVFTNGIITLQPTGLITKTVILNQAQIIAMYATPQLVVATAGAGTVIQVINASAYSNYQSSAFSGGGAISIQYGNTVHAGGTSALSTSFNPSLLTSSASGVEFLNGNTGNILTGISNNGLYISNASGSFTGGDVNSTLPITLTYQIISASV